MNRFYKKHQTWLKEVNQYTPVLFKWSIACNITGGKTCPKWRILLERGEPNIFVPWWIREWERDRPIKNSLWLFIAYF